MRQCVRFGIHFRRLVKYMVYIQQTREWSLVQGWVPTAVLTQRLPTMWHVCGHPYGVAQQKRGVGPMLSRHWASVVDDGSTSDQHWANASCLLEWVNTFSCDKWQNITQGRLSQFGPCHDTLETRPFRDLILK